LKRNTHIYETDEREGSTYRTHHRMLFQGP
jgi:hypothetical protein